MSKGGNKTIELPPDGIIQWLVRLEELLADQDLREVPLAREDVCVLMKMVRESLPVAMLVKEITQHAQYAAILDRQIASLKPDAE